MTQVLESFCSVHVKFPQPYTQATISLLMSKILLAPSLLLTLLHSARTRLGRRVSFLMTSEPPRRQPTWRCRSRRRTAHIHCCRSLWLYNKSRGRDRLHHPPSSAKKGVPFLPPIKKIEKLTSPTPSQFFLVTETYSHPEQSTVDVTVAVNGTS